MKNLYKEMPTVTLCDYAEKLMNHPNTNTDEKIIKECMMVDRELRSRGII